MLIIRKISMLAVIFPFVQLAVAQMVGIPYIVPQQSALAVTIANDQAICMTGSTATPQSLTSTITGGSGTCTYQWQSSSDNSTWSNISGAASATYLPASLAAGIYYYRLQVTGGGQTVISNAVRIMATRSLSTPVITLAGPCSSSNKMLVGGTQTMTASVPAVAGATYSWTLPSGLTAQGSTTGNSITFTADAPTGTPTSAVTSYTVSVTETGGCNSATATSATITAELLPNSVASAKLVAQYEFGSAQSHGFYVAWKDINGLVRYYVFGTSSSLSSYNITGISCHPLPNASQLGVSTTALFPLISDENGDYINFNASFNLVQLTNTNGRCNTLSTPGGGYINITGTNYTCGQLYPPSGGLLSIGWW